MDVFKAVFLGLLQGLTEFLPVSSSGHLVFFQRAMGMTGDMLLFDIVLHLGTLLAVAAVFRKELWQCVKHPLSPTSVSLAVATVPAVAAALLFRDFIEKAFSGSYLGFGFIITAVLLIAASVIMKGEAGAKYAEVKDINDPAGAGVKLTSAFAIGLFQGAAVLPGISRSGAALSGALVCGAGRERAANFSFLMSVPVILASAVYKIAGTASVTESLEIVPAAAGFAAAAVSGFLAIKLMLGLIKKCKLWYFSVYLLALGAFALLNQYVLLWF